MVVVSIHVVHYELLLLYNISTSISISTYLYINILYIYISIYADTYFTSRPKTRLRPKPNGQHNMDDVLCVYINTNINT